MGRKKKIDKIETAREWKPFNPDVDIPEPLAEIGPTIYSEEIDITTLNDSTRRMIFAPPSYIDYRDPYNSWITSTTGGNLSAISVWPSTTIDKGRWYDCIEKERIEQLKKEVGDVKIDVIKSSRRDEHIVACQNKEDLTIDNILTTLSAVKARLMYEIAPIHIKQIECRVTPLVKDTIIKANKKLKMYGKDKPIVACFDEYGKRLPDKIEIGESGITLYIVDPKEYGELYYELKAIELPNEEGNTMSNWWYDTPF